MRQGERLRRSDERRSTEDVLRAAYQGLAGLRRAPRRVRAGAEVPAADDLRVPAALLARAPATARARDGTPSRSTAWRAGGMYDHLGGGFHRYSVDASGSCRTSRRCSTTTPSSPRCTSTRGSSPASRRTAASPRRRSTTSSARCRTRPAASIAAGRRQRRRRGQVLRLDAGRDHAVLGEERCARRCCATRRDARAETSRAQHPLGPRRPTTSPRARSARTARGARSLGRARGSTRRATGASTRASTTRCSPRGTA